jgi:hypothetical protein
MYDGPDNSYEPREYDEDKSDDIHARIVEGAVYGLVLLIALYFWLRQYGWLVGVLGSLVLTLAAFAAYQWIRVWLNVRRQERGPADDGSPITLNLKASDSSRTDADDE